MLHAVATLLKASNPHMLRAIDGLDDKSDTLPSPHRSDPAVFFWTVFGLSFEALCTAPSSANSAGTTIQTVALDALGGLFRPDVAGTALNDEGLFDEVCNLCLRLALTEAAEVKARVLDITVGLVQLFVRDLPASGAVNGSDLNDKAARGDRRLTQCLRIAVAAFRESVPATSSSLKRACWAALECGHPLTFSEQPTATAATAASLAAHIRLVFSRFADVADLLPAQLRIELYAIAFHFYSGGSHVSWLRMQRSNDRAHTVLLKDEKNEIDFAAPTLPVLKTLCDRASARPDESQTLSKVLNGVLSACLLNIDAVR